MIINKKISYMKCYIKKDKKFGEINYHYYNNLILMHKIKLKKQKNINNI